MKTNWNCASGDTVFIKPRDLLRRVPSTHRELITPAIEAAFRNPRAHFRTVAAKCRFPALRRYLEESTKAQRWELRLHTNGYECKGIGAFAFGSSEVMPAEIAPAEPPTREDLPAEIAEFYSLVDWVHWSVYGGAGGLDRGGHHDRIADRGYPLKNPPVPAKQVVHWGSTPCGDAYVYTLDGRAGLVSHENGHLHILGTVGEAIDWIFSKLCQNEYPDFDYQWCNRDY